MNEELGTEEDDLSTVLDAPLPPTTAMPARKKEEGAFAESAGSVKKLSTFLLHPFPFALSPPSIFVLSQSHSHTPVFCLSLFPRPPSLSAVAAADDDEADLASWAM